MTDFDEYEALEAEAEALATNAQQPAQNQPSQAMPQAQQQTRSVGRPVGRPPKAQTQPQAQQTQQTQQAQQAQAPKQERPANVPEPQKIPRYIALHQPERIYIVDTQTEDVVAEGFKDDGVAMAMAKIMNDQDTIIVGAGYQ